MRTLQHYARPLLRCAAAAALPLALTLGCSDFLTGGDLSTDPNRPTAVTPSQLFVGVQTNTWALFASDMARVTGLWTQQFEGGNIQYIAIYNYGRDETTTNGFYAGLYGAGALADVRELQSRVTATGDKLFLGIAQVQEAMIVGTGADLFGDIVYSQALSGTRNPKLDNQLEVYDAVQKLLDQAIANLASKDPKNVGPGGADLAYGGDPAQWTRLAHTLKARFYLHTAEVRADAYAKALAEAPLGLRNPGDDYVAVFAGIPLQQNFWYQFDIVQRPGYLVPGTSFVSLLESRDDPRLAQYFNADQSDLAPSLIEPNATQKLATSYESRLVWAEAAYRTGDEATARTQLNAERAFWGLAPVAGSVSGRALLREILTEKYIALFQQIEPWNDYKRTCFPNLTPTVAGEKVPVRLFYDTAERQTNTSIPGAEDQPFRNRNDPANAVSDGTGEACKGQ